MAALILLAVSRPQSVTKAEDADKAEGATTARHSVAVPPGSKLANPKGSCLSFSGLKDAIIENVVVGPCASHGIELHDSHNVAIRNVVISDTGESGIYITGSTAIEITESRIGNAVAGVNVINSSGITVNCNTIQDPRGPIPRGQFVQFNQVSGGGNRISCNVGRNSPGHGRPEDGISLYKSHGTPESAIAVTDNLLVGGGPSESGGGIMLGDSGGSYQLAKANVLVDPGQYGIAVSSGHHISIIANLVFARRQAFTNVGIYAWNQYQDACHTILIEGNKVRWFSKTGRQNPYWNGQNCGTIAVINRNEFAAGLSPAIGDAKTSECQCHVEGRR